ncbi:MAG: transcription termination/antitermination protein NusA, partial [Proteobacteria bacterium]|nr:transcription termination/antitermination protein NusA [Pseudomonadota bacterium]
MAVGANKLEILQIAEAVAREKAIDKEIVIEAMEEAIQKAAKARYGMENNIRAQIDRENGDLRLFRIREVVEEVENVSTEISLDEVRKDKPEAEVGEFIAEPLPPIDYSRISAQTAKQVIVQKVRSAERERQYEEFKDRVGEIITGVVKRIEYGNVIVDLGRAEAIIPRDHVIPREHMRNNERIRAYIMDVRQENRGPQIFLSRTAPEFLSGREHESLNTLPNVLQNAQVWGSLSPTAYGAFDHRLASGFKGPQERIQAQTLQQDETCSGGARLFDPLPQNRRSFVSGTGHVSRRTVARTATTLRRARIAPPRLRKLR